MYGNTVLISQNCENLREFTYRTSTRHFNVIELIKRPLSKEDTCFTTGVNAL